MKTLKEFISERLILNKHIKHSMDYFQIEMLEDGVIEFDNKSDPILYYSFNTNEWIKWDYSCIKVSKGDIIYFKGDNSDGFSRENALNRFILNNKCNISGNIMSLLDQDNFINMKSIPNDLCFAILFLNCIGIIDASKLELPAINLSKNCYICMFMMCTSLNKAPNLVATKLSEGCYCNMFYCCKSLYEKPYIKGINDMDDTYCKDMFTDAPCNKNK